MKRNLGRERRHVGGLGAVMPPGCPAPRGRRSPGGDGHLCHPPQHGGLEQPHKGHEGLLQELHLPHQHVGGLGVLGDLLDEFVLQLVGKTRSRKGVVAKIWLFLPLFPPKLKPQAPRFPLWLSRDSQMWGLRSHIQESGRKNSQSQIFSETWLKLRLALNCTPRALQPNQQPLVLLPWLLLKENSLKFLPWKTRAKPQGWWNKPGTFLGFI